MSVPPSRLRCPALALVLGVAASMPGPVRGQEAAKETLRQRFAGEWRFAGGAAEEKAVGEAVERSVDGMFFIARGIAYDRLMHVCEICRSYALRFADGQVDVSGPCQLPDRSPDDGREVDHRTKANDASKLSQRFVDGTLVQDFRGEEGARRVVFALLPDGAHFSVHITITSKHLPHPVDYTLSYRRVPSVPAPAAADAGTPGG
jgi:hypothetical protein